MLLRNLRTALAAVALTSGAACPGGWVTAAFAQQTPAAQQIWTVPEVGALPNNAYGRLVRRGHKGRKVLRGHRVRKAPRATAGPPGLRVRQDPRDWPDRQDRKATLV